MKTLSRYFIKGTLVLLPFVLTAYVFYALFMAIDSFGHKILSLWIAEEFIVTGIGFLLTLVIILLAGYASSIWFGASIFRAIDDWMMEEPFIKNVYGVIRDTILSLAGKSAAFDKVVAVNFPELGFQRIGFVTREEISFVKDSEEKLLVFFPHSFQVSGNMLIVPRKNVTYIDMPKETAIKLIMSAGIVKK